ncbi:sensor histidine kinase [Erythrobacter litoralis]|nr:sensor histidine kinase [Erythrobacter litoralis]
MSPEAEDARVPLRTVLLSMAGLWTAYFLLVTVRGSIVGLELQDELLWRRALVCLGGMGITVLLWLAIRLFERFAMWVQILVAFVAALPAAAAIAQINQMTFASIEARVAQKIGEREGVNIRRDESGNLLVDVPGIPTPTQTDGPAATTIVLARAPEGIERWRQFTDVALGRYFLLLAWAALYLALVAAREAQLAERRGERFRTAAKAAELRSLRYQVNPHFLFNTLNSLSALVMTGKEERAEQMIQSISRFYRHSLAEDPTGDVSLEDEFDLQALYLEIEAVRFPKRLRIEIDLPPELRDCRVPGMILQPLVENSVKYGVSASTRPVTIAVSARETNERLVLRVTDDGPGACQANGQGFGIGLANVRDRLAARFGNTAGVEFGPTADGYETTLELPMVRHG